MSIKLLLVDDNERIRDNLGNFFKLLGGLEIVGAASTGKQALEQCAKLHPDVVLMDILMQEMDGIEATRIIREQYPDIQVVVLTSGFVAEAEAALYAGASRYIFKTASVYTIMDTIQLAYSDSHPQ